MLSFPAQLPRRSLLTVADAGIAPLSARISAKEGGSFSTSKCACHRDALREVALAPARTAKGRAAWRLRLVCALSAAAAPCQTAARAATFSPFPPGGALVVSGGLAQLVTECPHRRRASGLSTLRLLIRPPSIPSHSASTAERLDWLLLL
jgi:hypothetical protein